MRDLFSSFQKCILSAIFHKIHELILSPDQSFAIIINPLEVLIAQVFIKSLIVFIMPSPQIDPPFQVNLIRQTILQILANNYKNRLHVNYIKIAG